MLELRIDASRPLAQDPGTGHNRWHPAIEPLLRVRPGETVRLQLRDGLDGQVDARTEASRFHPIPGRAHPLGGPIAVEGAAPGDALELELLELEPDPYGFTFVMPEISLLAGCGLSPFLVHWEIVDGFARSEQLPGVAIPGEPFLGCAGVAPSLRRLRAIDARERALEAELGTPLAAPTSEGAVPPQEPIASEALHTIPPRECGGNLDVRDLGVGTTLLLPVEVPGGLASVGDPHFAQGDGEVCATAIEMRATATLRVGLRKAADLGWALTAPAYERAAGAPRWQRAARAAGAAAARERPVFATIGISVDEQGRNRALGVRTAAAAALSQLVDWLAATRGWRREQALALASVAADLRVSSIVNNPNAVVSAVLPLDVFTERKVSA
ncbi:MAG: acetamidase/formamidase family protein [Solirubrobacteraceae bacterium]